MGWLSARSADAPALLPLSNSIATQPSPICHSCLSPDHHWVQASGRATLFSFVIVHRALDPYWQGEVPYVVAVVELAEGPRLISNLIGIEIRSNRNRHGSEGCLRTHHRGNRRAQIPGMPEHDEKNFAISVKAAMRQISLLIVVMCSLSPQFANGQERKLEPFVVAYSSVTANRAPLWIARDSGLFEKYGLDVKFITIAAGNVVLSALLTGDVHLITAAGPQVVAAVAQGAPITIVSTNGGSLFQLVARPSIKTLQDLRGKVVGSSRIGAGTDFVLRRILDKIGLVPGKDVSLIATGLSESEKRILIMLQGKLDATLGEPDKVFQLMEMRGEKMTVLGDLRDFGIPVPGSEFVATKDFLKDHRGRLKNFLMAYSEAISLGRRNRELVYQAFKKYMRIEDREAFGLYL